MKAINLMLIILAFTATQTIAQENLTEKEDPYNQYRNEIGLDFQNILSSGDLGTKFIYKRRLKAKEDSTPNKHRALVVKLFGSGNFSIKSASDYDLGELSTQEFRDIFTQSYSVSGLVGIEWQHQKRKVQCFYGLMTGYRRFVSISPTSFFTNQTSVMNYFLELTTEKEHRIPLHVYGGVKYFITPRFSLSIDSKFEIDFRSTRREITTTGSDQPEDEKEKRPRIQRVNYFVDYLNTLNFSYYF